MYSSCAKDLMSQMSEYTISLKNYEVFSVSRCFSNKAKQEKTQIEMANSPIDAPICFQKECCYVIHLSLLVMTKLYQFVVWI